MKRKTKVMFIVYHDLKIEARSQEILEMAKQMGDVTLVSFATYQPQSSEHKEVIAASQKNKKSYIHFIVKSIMTILKEKPEIIILHDDFTAVILAWIKLTNRKVYTVFDSSELYIDRKISNLKLFLAQHMQITTKYFLKYVDFVIAANEDRSRIMKDYYRLENAPYIFDNVHRIETNYDSLSCNNKFRHLNLSNTGRFKILYAGGIANQRRTIELAHAVGRLGNDYQLIIIGSADKQEHERLVKIIGSCDYKNITYEGFVSREELKYLIQHTDISVSLFLENNLNNKYCASGKIFESLFEGKPILVSENPPLKKLCDKFQIGISNNNLQEGILNLREQYEQYEKNVISFVEKLDNKEKISTLAKEIHYDYKRKGGEL